MSEFTNNNILYIIQFKFHKTNFSIFFFYNVNRNFLYFGLRNPIKVWCLGYYTLNVPIKYEHNIDYKWSTAPGHRKETLEF